MKASIEAIEGKLNLMKVEEEKFSTKNNKAAGTRVRLLAMDIIKECRVLRNQVTEIKNKA